MTGIVLAPTVPVLLLVVLAAAAAILIAYGVMRRARGALLRALPVAALLVALADPQLVTQNHVPLKDVAVVVVDNSDSQTLPGRQARTQQAVEKLTADLGATENIEVRTVQAGRDGATGRQDGTNLFGTLLGVLNDIPRHRLAGVIMVTDGQVHDAPDPERARQSGAPYMDAPVHVLITGEKRESDRRIRIEASPDFGLVGRSATLRLKVEDTAAPEGTPAQVRIRRNGANVQNVTLPTGRPTDVQVPVENAGANVFETEIDARPGEISTANNRVTAVISGVRDRLRVLLVSGHPHVGERAWRNLLKSDPNVDLIHFTILRPSDKGDGTPVKELALIMFPMRELFEQQLPEFDLVIFDRYGSQSFIPMQYMFSIARYVERGGAIMLSVGPEFSEKFALFGKPLQDVLSVQPTGRIYSGAFRPQLSEVGKRHPVTASLDRGSDGPNGAATWGRWLRQVQVIPGGGSNVLTGEGGEPLLLLNRVGEGRVAVLLSDTSWLWGKGFEGGGPQTELIRRTAHWLMKEPELEEEALKADVTDTTLTVTRRSLSPQERPVTIMSPSGTAQTVVPKDSGQGRFIAQVAAPEPGLYRLNDGTRTALAAVGAANPLEVYDVVATPTRLEPLTRATGGGIYWLEDGPAPTIRRVAEGRVAHGSTWLGLLENNQTMVAGLSQTPLLPFALLLLAVMGGAMLAWWREGR